MTAFVQSLALSVQQLALVSLEALDEVPAPEDVRPGWVAMGSFFLLFAVTILLWMSMRKQIGRIRFDDGVDRSAPRDPDATEGEHDGPGTSGGSAPTDGPGGSTRPGDAPVFPAAPGGPGSPRA